MKERRSYIANLAEGGDIVPLAEGADMNITAQIIVPIVAGGDCLGAVFPAVRGRGRTYGSERRKTLQADGGHSRQPVPVRRGKPLLHMKQNFLKGPIIISVGGIAAKILGAFYRIPLTNILGGEGMGVYQMVYPLYCLLLTVSATGIPSGLARIVSSAESRGDHAKSRAVLFKSLLLFSGVGLCGSALMFLLAPAMSAAQGEIGAVAAYRALAPGVFFVSVLSCLRGWFQGQEQLFPTAFSEICEQAVKVALGLFFARAFRGEPFKAVARTLASVTFSEFAACLLLAFLAWGGRTKRPLFRERVQDLRAKQLLRVTIPVTVAAGLLPLSNLLDSILIVRLVGRYASNATALYGLYAGAAATLVNLPVSVCYGIAAAIIPAVSACQSKGLLREAEERTLFALKCTLFLSLPAAAFLLAFPSGVTSFLFSSVTGRGRGKRSPLSCAPWRSPPSFSPACRRSPPA